MFFLTQVEPVNLLRGTDVRFFLREHSATGHRSHVITRPSPHYFYTPPVLHTEAAALLQQLNAQPDLEHLLREKRKYNNRRSFIRVTGSKEDLPLLPASFRPSTELLNSPSRQLRWLYSPTLLVDSPDHIPSPDDIITGKFRRQYAPLEALINDSYAVIDIEMEGWAQGREHIFMAVYLSPLHKIIFHDLPFDQQEQEGFQLQQFSSPQDLGTRITALLQEEDPLWIYGHNVMRYDQIKIRDCTHAYFPATDGHYPVTKSTQGLGRVLTKGRFTLDTYAYHFTYGNLLANSSLGTLSLQKRPLTHAQQASSVVSARQGNQSAFQELVHYCIGDGFSSLEVAERVKEPLCRIATHFRTSPDRVCTTGKLTTAEDYWQRRHFLIKGTSLRFWRKKEKPLSIDQLTCSLLTKGFVNGFHEDVQVLYLTPFVAGAHDLLVRRGAALLRGIPPADPWGKYALLQTLNADLSFLVQEYGRIVDDSHGAHFRTPPEQYSEKEKAALYCLFEYHLVRSVDSSGHSSRVNPMNFARSIAAAVANTNRALQRQTIINQGHHLTFVRGDIDIQRLEESFYGCSFGRGPALSLRPGRIIANPFQEMNPSRFIYQGYSFEKGRKSNFEKRVARDLLTKIFAGERFDSITAALDQEINEFITGKKPEHEYYIIEKTQTYYHAELTRLLEQQAVSNGNSIPPAVLKSYRQLEHRLGNTPSPPTRKEVRAILDQCLRDFSFPYLEELWEKIQHPFPPSINLVIDERGKLVPISLAPGVNLQKYREKVQHHFAEFYTVLRPVQQELRL